LRGQVIKALNLETIPSDDLWQLYEQVGRLLTKRLASEKHKLEQRLSLLRSNQSQSSSETPRRPYPRVYPKYRNPGNPSQTWAGRGKAPRWISDMLAAGKSIDDLLIDANET